MDQVGGSDIGSDILSGCTHGLSQCCHKQPDGAFSLSLNNCMSRVERGRRKWMCQLY